MDYHTGTWGILTQEVVDDCMKRDRKLANSNKLDELFQWADHVDVLEA
jgi:hypothetical protein